MSKITLELDDAVVERARQVAAARHTTLERLAVEALEKEVAVETMADPFFGLFADEPEMVDELIEDIMHSRETQSLRSDRG